MAKALLRFDEISNDLFPVDDAGNLADLAKTGAALPDLVDAAVGRGRAFTSADGDGLQAQDVVPGSTLITRDATVQVILSWDIDDAATYGAPQTIYARGKGTGAAEYVGTGLELRVVNATLRIGELRWIWQDLAGNLKTQIGGHFQVPVGGFLMLTATRRWVSSSRVVLRYFLGDALLAEIESTDGEIGGGTTGTTTIGTRYTGAAFGRFLDGVIDELRVLDEELTAEEIAMTFRRITVEQPRGYQLIREMHDPGFPISQDPGSRAQRETRMWGDGLGFAAAQAENIRENILPDRAYGRILERWEALTKQPAKPGDDVDTRRRRVVGKIRQRRGVSIPGIGDALRELADTDPENLEVHAFDQTMVDTWESLNILRWRHMPASAFTLASNALRLQSTGDRSEYTQWRTTTQPIGGRGLNAKILTKITPTTIANQGEVGVMLLDHGAQHAALLGLRNDAGTYRIVRTTVENGIAAAATNLAAPGLVPVWLLLEHQAGTTFRARWSTVSASGPWTEATFAHARMDGTRTRPMGDAGMYGRTWSAAAANIDVAFDDTRVRTPNGTRPFRLYVVRDPGDPGAPDYLGANTVISGLRQTHTVARVVHSMRAKYDNANTSYDREPMGGNELVDPAPVGALPTFVAKGAQSSGTGANTPGLPAGIALNDILILAVGNSIATLVDATLSNAEGFVAVPAGAINSGLFGGVRCHETLFWRRYDGTGAAPTVADNGDFNLARIYAFRGCTTVGNPWDGTPLTDGDDDGDTTLTVQQAGNTLGGNRLVVTFFASFTGGTTSIAGYANADLANLTELDDLSVAVGADWTHLGVVSGERAAAGPFGNTTAAWTGAAYRATAAVTLALKP